MLAKRERASGKRTDLVARGDLVDSRRTLSDLGVTKDQSSRWQTLAGVPEEDFEAALAGEEKPSTNGIIAKPPQMPETSLWLWGRLRDFERDGLLEMSSDEATELLAEMAESGERRTGHGDQKAESQRATPLLADLGRNGLEGGPA